MSSYYLTHSMLHDKAWDNVPMMDETSIALFINCLHLRNCVAIITPTPNHVKVLAALNLADIINGTCRPPNFNSRENFLATIILWYNLFPSFFW